MTAAPPYLHSVKLAFEAPRFWETDDNIFGGLAWTDRLNENVLYPSGGIGGAKGVIVGAYCAGWTNQDNPDEFAALSTRSGSASAGSRSRRFTRADRSCCARA